MTFAPRQEALRTFGWATALRQWQARYKWNSEIFSERRSSDSAPVDILHFLKHEPPEGRQEGDFSPQLLCGKVKEPPRSTKHVETRRKNKEGQKKTEKAIVSIVTRRDVCGSAVQRYCQPVMTLGMISRKTGNNESGEVV